MGKVGKLIEKPFRTGASSANRQAEMANNLAGQGVALEQQAFNLAREQDLRTLPLQHQQVIGQTGALGGAGNLLAGVLGVNPEAMKKFLDNGVLAPEDVGNLDSLTSPGGLDLTPAVSGVSTDLAQSLSNPFKAGGALSQENVNLPGLTQPGRMVNGQFIPGAISTSRIVDAPNQVQGNIVGLPNQVQAQNINRPDLVQGQATAPGAQVQGRVINAGDQVSRNLIRPRATFHGRVVDAGDIVGADPRSVTEARERAQADIEREAVNVRRSVGSRNQFGGGQVDAAERGLRFLSSQAGGRAAQQERQRISDIRLGQQLQDRDRLFSQRLSNEQLRQRQGLEDRDLVTRQLLGQEDLRISQGLQDRDRDFTQRVGNEALRQSQSLADRELDISERQGIEQLRRGQELGDRQGRIDEALSNEQFRRGQDVADRQNLTNQLLGNEGFRREQAIADRESLRGQQQRQADVELAQNLSDRDVLTQQLLGDRQTQIAQGLANQDLIRSQAIKGMDAALSQEGSRADLQNQVQVANQGKQFEDALRLISLITGQGLVQNIAPQAALSAGAGIGSVAQGLGNQAAARQQSANAKMGQLFGLGLNAAGAGGMFGGNIQGMFRTPGINPRLP